MKKLLIAALLVLASRASAQIIPAGDNSYSGYLANEAGLAYSKNYTLDLAPYNGSRVSAQVIYGTTTYSVATFTDGSQSTVSFTVVNYAKLMSAKATDYLTVSAVTGLANAQITFTDNYYRSTLLINGRDWTVGATTGATATSIAAAINANIPGVTAVASGAIVYSTAASVGSRYNLYAMSSNNGNITVNAANFAGGQDAAYLTIGGTVLTYGASGLGTFSGASNGAMATSIASAITASSLGLTAGATGAVVYATSTLNGTQYNYAVASSSPGYLSVSASTMTGGTNSGATAGKSYIYSSAHGLTLGLPVLYASNSATIGGLTNQTTYYAIPEGANYVSLATTSARAVLGLPLVVTSTTSQITAHTPSLTPLALAGSPAVIWQSSNDNTNYVTAASTGSISISASGDLGVDFGAYNYRYLRLKATGPTAGGVLLQVPVNIKQDGIGRF